MSRICCIGHITCDHIVTPEFSVEMPGGTAWYFAGALRGVAPGEAEIITAVGDDLREQAQVLAGEECEMIVLPSVSSVVFENRYGTDRDKRTQRVLAKAAPFRIEDIPEQDVDYYHLGSLLNDDFDLEFIKQLSRRGRVSLDVQGLLREVRGEDVVHIDYPQKRELMKYVDVLKANEIEMEVLTGSSDPRQAARILADWGCREVVLTLGSGGSVIYSDGEYFDIPAYRPTEVVDATGCGDTYMAAYLYRRSKGDDWGAAGRYAAAMCSLKLARKGPLVATAEEVEKALGEWRKAE